jgi:polysaccharide export outer membrane protein
MRIGTLALRMAAAAALAVQAGCGWLPAAGPSKSEVLESAGKDGGIVVAGLSRPVIDTLQERAPPRFSGGFPPYRPLGQQVIGVGDFVRVVLWEAGAGGLFSTPALSLESPGSRTAQIPDQVVGNDGAITVPYAGRVQVVGRTPAEIESAIVAKLEDMAIRPQALVTVTRNISNTASVLGEVRQPNRLPLSTAGDRLLEVIALAGGVAAPVTDLVVQLTRDGRTIAVPLQVLLQTPAENVFVRPGDVITLTRQPQHFFALGALQRAGQIPFDAQGISLAEALGKVGGLMTERADPEGVFLLRYEPTALAKQLPTVKGTPADAAQTPVAYQLNMRDPVTMLASRGIAIRSGDILFVSDAPLIDVQKVFGLFQLLTSPAITAAAVRSGW